MRIAFAIALMLLAGPVVAQPAPPAPAPKPLPTIQPLNSGFAPMRGLAPGQSLRGLPVVGDAKAQCRSTCATVRISCGADDEGCTERWTQCVAACGR